MPGPSRVSRGRAVALAVCVAPFASLVIAGWPSACSPPSDARIGVDTPDESLFPPVANLLAYRCGSLDCHGSPQRNFVIWSCYGLRLEPDASPGCLSYTNGTPSHSPNSTSAEDDATFRSLVGLEPAVMSQVVASHGQNPDLLTFVRKARGEESHKGGTLFTAGDLQDLCVAQWLAGSATTKGTCTQALVNDIDAGTL